MHTASELSPAICLPDHARHCCAFGESITFHMTGQDSGGRYTMFTEVTPPGGGPPIHVHEHEDEWFLILEGSARFFINDQWHDLPVGTTVFAPRRSVHTLKNVGQTPLKMLIHTAPSGFEIFFTRCAEEFARTNTGPDMERIIQISAEHGIRFVNS